ncbi:MAG: hypothetical protein PVJ39_07260 [Gammaproteobacteria bacterium]|jgi:mono/diheme cytochrome c family protein
MKGSNISTIKLIFVPILCTLVLAGCTGAKDSTGDGGDGGAGGGTTDKTTGSAACLSNATFQDYVAQVDLADAAQGGRLYDEWWTAIYKDPPTETHPLWPQSNTAQSGAATWRCKECHGWDYKGADGVYGDTESDHYTGFSGIARAASNEPIEVFCKIRDASNIPAAHAFSEQLNDSQIRNLTKFIIASQNEDSTTQTPQGVINTSSYISDQGIPKNADPTNGEMQYLDISVGCATSTCHDTDGTRQHEALGTIASENPWEMLHKIRFGHPASTMPAYSAVNSSVSLTLQQSLDIVAYAQNSLPDPEATADTACLTEFESYVTGSIASADTFLGGQLYDKWWEAAGTTPPAGNHPLWSQQSTNTRTGLDTWRCKECHGWDYKGASGVYNSGSDHYTGFPGILTSQNSQPINVFCAIYAGTGITLGNHSFSTRLDKSQVLDLARFITDGGVINTSNYIDAGGNPIGDSAEGATIYTSINGCSASNCHDADGAGQPEPLGVLSNENPWEVMHKIRFSDPGAIMPAFARPGIPQHLNLTQIADVIAYTQTLGGTAGGGASNQTDLQIITRGGRLYDNWIDETGSTAPPVDNPVWELRPNTTANASTGVDTWRCKECHGWDYKGVNGIYGNPSSAHYTGFGGVFGTEKTEAQIVTYLTTGFFDTQSLTNVHKFGDLLQPADIEALAKFIKQGTIDVSIYFGSDGIINGLESNFRNGETLYSFLGFGVVNGNCALCHETNGKKPDGLVLGVIANENPWEFLHKVRFGQPGTIMPSLINAVDPLTQQPAFETQDAVDVTQFSQSLPVQ